MELQEKRPALAGRFLLATQRRCINEFATGRILRDAKLYAIGAGTNEIQRMLIGRELFDGKS